MKITLDPNVTSVCSSFYRPLLSWSNMNTSRKHHGEAEIYVTWLHGYIQAIPWSLLKPLDTHQRDWTEDMRTWSASSIRL